MCRCSFPATPSGQFYTLSHLYAVFKLMNSSLPHELKQDSFDAIGAENVEWRVIESGHEFPLTHADEVVSEICGVWGI